MQRQGVFVMEGGEEVVMVDTMHYQSTRGGSTLNNNDQ
jgi:hypothetical protein